MSESFSSVGKLEEFVESLSQLYSLQSFETFVLESHLPTRKVIESVYYDLGLKKPIFVQFGQEIVQLLNKSSMNVVIIYELGNSKFPLPNLVKAMKALKRNYSSCFIATGEARQKDDIKQAALLGAKQLWVKPLSQETLKSKLTELLEK